MLPTIGAILAALNVPDALTISIRGFAAIDAALDVLILDALHERESFELDRVNAALKIGLVVALGVVASSRAPAYRKLAKIRNSFAHSFDASFDEADAKELLSVLSEEQRVAQARLVYEVPAVVDTLRAVTLCSYAELLGSIRQTRESRLESDAAMAHLVEVAQSAFANGLKVPTPNARVKEHVARLRAERGWEEIPGGEAASVSPGDVPAEK